MYASRNLIALDNIQLGSLPVSSKDQTASMSNNAYISIISFVKYKRVLLKPALSMHKP